MSISDVRFILMALLLIFLFNGEPDVWDVIHNAAMNTGCTK